MVVLGSVICEFSKDRRTKARKTALAKGNRERGTVGGMEKAARRQVIGVSCESCRHIGAIFQSTSSTICKSRAWLCRITACFRASFCPPVARYLLCRSQERYTRLHRYGRNSRCSLQLWVNWPQLSRSLPLARCRSTVQGYAI